MRIYFLGNLKLENSQYLHISSGFKKVKVVYNLDKAGFSAVAKESSCRPKIETLRGREMNLGFRKNHVKAKN